MNIKLHLDELKDQAKYNWFPQPQGPLNSDNNTAVRNTAILIHFNDINALAHWGWGWVGHIEEAKKLVLDQLFLFCGTMQCHCETHCTD